jgi:hypothetical protein
MDRLPQTRTSKDFRLKDMPKERSVQFIHLKNVFGFQPETIIIEKVESKNNRIRVHAIVPEDIIKEMEDEEARLTKALKAKETK